MTRTSRRPGGEPADLRRWLTAACVGLGLFTVALDTTVATKRGI